MIQSTIYLQSTVGPKAYSALCTVVEDRHRSTRAVDGLGAFEHLPITANGRIGDREKGASEKRRDDAHEEDFHDGHAWKDHSVADVRPVSGSELVRVGEDHRIATGARNDARHLVERHAEKEEAQ